jgi:hypothetical protein
MLSMSSYIRIVRASAWYDLVVTIGFATPWTFALVLSSLQLMSGQLGIVGDFPPFAADHMLMANLLGSIVTVWAIFRLRGTQARYGRYDAAGRLLFATWQLYAVLHGAHPVIWGFLLAEVAFGIAQLLPVAVAQRQPFRAAA